ncbi:hypothetical protein Leryth_012054 [Lithospermum erythrorhizon]|nr:hypothetical protein Leryth_012054 [Lithospermum erythrorhizon]
MAKCSSRISNGSVALNHHECGGVNGGGNFKIWSSLRCMILDTMRCGGGKNHHHTKKPNIFYEEKYSKTKENSNIDKDSKIQEKPIVAKAITLGESLRSEVKREKLSELLSVPELSDLEAEEKERQKEVVVMKKMEALEHFKKVVNGLSQCQNDMVLEAAMEVRRLTKEDFEARTTLALLGAIPPLVALLEVEVLQSSSQIEALYALLNLSINNDENKAAIVKAGAVHKMLKLIHPPDDSAGTTVSTSISEAVVANFLGLSALDSNKELIGSSGAIPFLVKTLKQIDGNGSSSSSSQAKEDALRALYNLSISPSNIYQILDKTDLVPFLVKKLGDMSMSERSLSILSNIVSIPEGRKTISKVPDVFPILIDVLSWMDSPGCQEKASYILMVMAHKSYHNGDRQAMIDSGISSSLLELTLLGSTLAQKRASRILECLRVDKGKQVDENYVGDVNQTLSAPLCGMSTATMSDRIHHSMKRSEDREDGNLSTGNMVMISEERKAVKQLVQQSLQNNMKRIAKRANLPHDFVPSDHFQALTTSSTSKSLPF